jgi:cohesin complex subunit SA-1/2
MSTSPLRSFRHTATVVALNVETALCEVAASVEKEKETVIRQLEGERKKKRNTERVKELEMKSTEVNERRTKLKEYLKEFFDG